MNVSKVVGWAPGETPTVPKGFKIEAIATGLSNPRNVYPLPNGDLLVVESKKDAKEPAAATTVRATASSCCATAMAMASPMRKAS